MIISPDFLDHWKTQLLVAKLDGDQSAPLRVIRLWSHCQNRRKNIFPAMTSATLKAVCHYLGDADKLESAMLEAGFIRRDGDMLIVHEWDQYNASLFSNWSNGKKGGRPKNKENPRVSHGIPTGNPRVSDGIPMANPSETHQEPIREDKKREEEIEIPASLQTSRFRQAWSEYLDYRKASRLKPLQPASIKAQLLKLSEIGHDTAIEAITNSIANGWQGIHPPKKNHPQTEARKPVVRSI
jgi:hypothetical protein